MSRDLSLKTEK